MQGAAVGADGPDPIIDIHQHLGYSGRSDAVLLAHQRAMGATTTILLPAGRPAKTASTHFGNANGLQAQALGNDACYRFATTHGSAFRFGANEVPDIDGATREIERYLKRGAVLIAEQKFGVDCDAPAMQAIYQLAQAHRVPVLMHWQFGMYNNGFERFHTMLEKYSRVTFLGHAQTWWANIDREHSDQSVLYPEGTRHAGGLTDRYLGDYPNMYGDLSAGSGLNALTRDEAFTPRVSDAAPGQARVRQRLQRSSTAPGRSARARRRSRRSGVWPRADDRTQTVCTRMPRVSFDCDGAMMFWRPAAAIARGSERRCSSGPQTPEIRVGIIGTDTSHVTAFTKLLNDKNDPAHVPGARVVAAFKGGSPDVEASRTRVDKFAAELKDKWGVEFVDSIEALAAKVDAVLLESVDGRPHLEQVRPVFGAKKRVFVDKPLPRATPMRARSSGCRASPGCRSSARRVCAMSPTSRRSGRATNTAGFAAPSRSGPKTWSRIIRTCSGTAFTPSKCSIRCSDLAAKR